MNWPKLLEDGILHDLYKRGFLSPKVFTYIEFCERVDAYRQQGFTRGQSIEKTADRFGVDTSTVRRALKACN